MSTERLDIADMQPIVEHLYRRECPPELENVRSEVHRVLEALPELAPVLAKTCHDTYRWFLMSPGTVNCNLVGGCVPSDDPKPIGPHTDVDLTMSFENGSQSGLYLKELSLATENKWLHILRLMRSRKMIDSARTALQAVRDKHEIPASRLQFHEDGQPTTYVQEAPHVLLGQYKPSSWTSRIRLPFTYEVRGWLSRR